MSVVEAGRSPAQRVAIASGLGRLPAGVRDGTFVTLAGEVANIRQITAEVTRTRSEMDYAKLAGRSTSDIQKNLDDAAQRLKTAADALASQASKFPTESDLAKGLTAIAQPIDAGSREAFSQTMQGRLDALTTALDTARAASDLKLYESNADVRAAADALSSLTRLALVDQALVGKEAGVIRALDAKTPVYGFSVAGEVTPFTLRNGDQVVDRITVEPSGYTSNLTYTVRSALDAMKGLPVQAIVLLSDGRQVGGEGAINSSLSAAGVPIYTIPVADSVAHDLSVRDISLPVSAFVNETVTVHAQIAGSGVKGTTIDVTLVMDDVTKIEKVTFADDGVMPVDFQIKLDKPGPKQLKISVPTQAGEVSADNNAGSRWLKVLGDKIRITAVASEPGWDFAYLRNALARTPWVEIKDYALEGASQKLAASVDEIRASDVLILSDVAVESLSDEQWDAVHQSVTGRGGSVILQAGSAHVPQDYAKHVLLSGFLPFTSEQMPKWRTWPGEEPYFHVIPAPGADRIDAMRLSEDPVANKGRWQTLPAFYRCLPLGDLKPNTRALLVERDSNAPVFTESRVGLGRVFFVGIDETWRWRYKVGERDQDKFWLQMIRYAAEEPYAVHHGGYSLDAERISIAPGEQVRIRARVLDDKGAPSRDAKQEVRILRNKRNVQTVTLDAIGENTGRYAGAIGDLEEGEYTLQLVASDLAPVPTELTIQVIRSAEAEMVDLTGDEKFLKRLADASGGKLVPIEQLSELPELLQKSHDEKSRLSELSLWDSPYLFVFVLACLSIEWAMRKQFGLA